MRILIASPQRIFRECLAHWLKGENFCCDCTSFPSQVVALASEPAPDLVLVDHNQRREEEILRWISDARIELPGSRVLVIGDEDSERHVTRYIEAGAAGFVTNSRSLPQLKDAIESVLRHDAECSPAQVSLVFARLQQLSRGGGPSQTSNSRDLTSRELEILKLIDLGRSNREIAKELHLSVHTVKTHVHNILEKLGAVNRRRAVYLAYHYGWMSK